MSVSFKTPAASCADHCLDQSDHHTDHHSDQRMRSSIMKPRIHVITLAVADLDRALAFYRDGLGFLTDGLIGAEFTGDETTPDGTTAGFHLDGGLMLSIYPRSELAKDAAVALTAAKPGELSIGHVLASRPELDEVLAQAKAAGAAVTESPHDRPWGIYSGYFQDPDGHLWEIIWNPALDLDDEFAVDR